MNNDNGGFAAYALYNALKLHFTTKSYDYIKYHGKTSVTKTNFLSRKDKYHFYRLSRKYNLDDLKQFYVANFVENPKTWPGELLGESAEEIFLKWKKRIQSLTYNFDNDILKLFEKYKPKEILHIKGDYPPLLKELMEGNINLETVCYMNVVIRFLPVWKKQIQDDIIWPMWEEKIAKYTPLIFDEYTGQTCESIMKKRFKEANES
jgi:hypothetical protein